MPKIEKGDVLSLEVLRAWAGGTVTFSLCGYPGVTSIPDNSPQIVGVDKAKPKGSRGRADT